MKWLHNWWRQPQRVWLRRAVFQVHLWIGIGIGLYIVMLSLTGSVLVYRTELDRWLATPRPQFDANAQRLSKEELQAAARRAYPGYDIVEVRDRITRRNPAAAIYLERDGATKERLFNPYTGEDLGDVTTKGQFLVLWLAQLHDDLLMDMSGRFWNGIGSALATILVLTGSVVWWPGIQRWRRSLGVSVAGGWRRFTWDLHSAAGFWLFPFLLMWSVSGFYLGIPQPFTDLVDAISDPQAQGERPGDVALYWLARLHFGRWRNGPLKALWAAVGLAPAVMFITGLVMWWNRVLRRRGV